MAAMEILYLSSTYKLIYVFKIREIYKEISMFTIAMISDVEYREFQSRLLTYPFSSWSKNLINNFDAVGFSRYAK